MARDGKNKFYRTLSLDKETNKALKFYRKWKRVLMDDRSELILPDDETDANRENNS